MNDEVGRAIEQISWIVLTMGDRRGPLAAAVASIPRPDHVETEVIVVVNGARDAVLPEGVRSVKLAENLGIPGGRNEGASVAHGTLLFFLDDDATVADPALVERCTRRFADEPDLAVVSFRIADPETGDTSQRHVPRLGRRDPNESVDVTSFLGGACVVRAVAFREVGGLPAEFFYALEETDLAWRLIDAGWRVAYDGVSVVHHPKTEIDRHSDATRITARNRVLLARRRLPWMLAPMYVADWFLLTLARTRQFSSLWSGTREGLRATVDREPMQWRTVWKLTRLGRPPVI